ncbi:hypothetical protein [Streptomyces sp. NPDC046870]|uniref:hypothetical protein n=1 Tax=Streptomyces sp. NPDC046870 TaxID=3155135 RepID=UPI003451B9AB
MPGAENGSRAVGTFGTSGCHRALRGLLRRQFGASVSEEGGKYRDPPFRSPASLEVFAYGREPARPGSGAAAPAPT